MRASNRHHPWGRCLGVLALLLVLLATTAACRVERMLMPGLPEEAGDLLVTDTLTQTFSAPSDGLNQLSIGVVPMTPTSGRVVPSLTHGATFEIHYAPELDPAYPDGAFHDWPEDQAWLGELTGERSVGQTFVSRYPNLNGITLRVATYGADLSPGLAQLVDGPPVPVLLMPVNGEPITELPGGSRVVVDGAAEGWVRVRLDGGRAGYIHRDHFVELPPSDRVNDRDVLLELYREGDTEPLRTARLNAAEMHDNSHVTFRFEPIADSHDVRYRFTLTSPDAEPGNAVTFRYASRDLYPDGTRFEGGDPVEGDLIFRPAYAPGEPLYRGELDQFVLSGQTNALEGTIPPLEGTLNRSLRLVIRAGDAPLPVTWSTQLPPGGERLTVSGGERPVPGALVFNVGFRGDLPLGSIAHASLLSIGRSARHDPGFFMLYGLALVGAAGWGLWALVGRRFGGR